MDSLTQELSEPAVVAGGRYRIEGKVGRGGVAEVFQVRDLATERSVALKRLLHSAAGGLQPSAVALFEREFFTLSHLVHPRIVRVYDYGIDESGPYYTMELLDGGDLQQRAPMAFREACAVARDVCSALSLLHSRRLVYRDLSPRNVRCTSSGLAKLIDFGAMSPMGPSREWVGTLPFAAPEVVNSQPLDARTDLYALGATLYYTLTRRHAYPAREVSQLYALWQERPPRPSALVPGIPEALDVLVMDLMHPDPAVRPASAAEVMERLAAIAELPPDEQVLVSKAYLSTPTLVGRGETLGRIKRIVTRALRRRGTSVAFTGPPGVGRSRVLRAIVLEAKLSGALVLQADSSDVHRRGYGVVRALAGQLLRAAPELALEAGRARAGILAHVVPELLEGAHDAALEAIDDPEQLAQRLQPALRQWLLDVSRSKPVVIAVDDVHRIDEPSAAFLALLSQEVSQHAVVVATTAVAGSISSGVLAALKLLFESSSVLALENLGVQETEELLRSVFGDVPNLKLLTHHLHAIAAGNPRDLLALAQHLVDSGVVRYQAGAWSVPDRIDAAEMPSNMAQALDARAGALSREARQLATAMALAPGQRYGFEECLLLCDQELPARSMQLLDELVSAGVLRSTGRNFCLEHEGLLAALERGSDPGERSSAHMKLAELFGRRGDGFRMAQHLMHAEERELALDALIEFAERSRRETDANPAAYFETLRNLPDDWYQFYDRTIALAAELGKPEKEQFQLRARLSGLLSISLGNYAGAGHYVALIEQLYRATGLDIYTGLDAALDPRLRLKQSLEQALLRYQAGGPNRDLVLEPKPAIAQFVRTVLEALGLVSFSHDYALLKKIPDLTPLEAALPALGVAIRLARGLEARITGRIEESLASYREYSERLLQPDGGGIAPTLRLYTRLRVVGSMGILEAGMGRRSSLDFADEIESHPLCESFAVVIRMVCHLWQGDLREAERCQKKAEMLQIQSGSRQAFGAQQLLLELAAYALADDLTRVKRTLSAVEPLAKTHAGWLPVLHYGRGEYQRIRGDHAAALAEIEAALAAMEPVRHQIWPLVAGAQVRVLCELGLFDEAKRRAEEHLRVAEERGLGYMRYYILMPLALVESELGDHAGAAARADVVIDGFKRLGTTGLNLALAYEVRARIASGANDREAFEKFAMLAAEQTKKGGRRMAGAKYERLAQQAQGSAPSNGAVDEVTQVFEFTALLKRCRRPSERARAGLEVLAKRSGSVGGLLYERLEEGLVRSAQAGEFESTSELETWVQDYFESEIHEPEMTRTVDDPSSGHAVEWKGPGSVRYVPILLSHQSERGFAVTGVAVMAVEESSEFVYPGRFAQEFSRFVDESGDVTAMYS